MKNLKLKLEKGNKNISTLKKYYNGTWNSFSKTWDVKIKEKDEEVFLANFSDYITDSKEIENKEVVVNLKDTKKVFVPANHATPGHFVYETGNYGDDVLSGFYQEG